MYRLMAIAMASFPIPAVAQGDVVRTGSDGTVRMTPTQIADYNSALTPTDPGFIKCVRTENPGSMVKRRICRTNADWNDRAANASDEARAIVDSVQLHGASQSQEPAGSLVPLTPN